MSSSTSVYSRGSKRPLTAKQDKRKRTEKTILPAGRKQNINNGKKIDSSSEKKTSSSSSSSSSEQQQRRHQQHDEEKVPSEKRLNAKPRPSVQLRRNKLLPRAEDVVAAARNDEDAAVANEKVVDRTTTTKPSYAYTSCDSADQDTASLFGSLPDELFAAWNGVVDRALSDAVKSLPFLPASGETVDLSSALLRKDGDEESESEKGGDEKLLELLRRAYAKQLDKTELYARRNVFSFDNGFSRSKRARVTELFQSDASTEELWRESTDNKDTKGERDDEVEPSSHDSLVAELTSVDSDDASLPQTLSALEEEVRSLREKHMNLTQRRKTLDERLQRIRRLKSNVRNANDILRTSISGVISSCQRGRMPNDNNNNNDNINNRGSLRDVVNCTIVAKRGLEELTERGHELSDRMDREKKLRGDDTDDMTETWNMLKRERKANQKNLTIDEHITLMKQRMPGSTTVENITSSLHAMKKFKKN